MEALLPKDIVDPSKLMSISSGNNNVGTGQIQRNEAVTLSVAGVVTQVLPNGNLVVAARQEFRVNDELREMQVTGVIRTQDITSENTVQSNQIAEARIEYGGRGQLTDIQTPRWGQQVMDIRAAVLIADKYRQEASANIRIGSGHQAGGATESCRYSRRIAIRLAQAAAAAPSGSAFASGCLR